MTRKGPRDDMPRAMASTATIERDADAIRISGSAEMWKFERKRASRVALPATCVAIIAKAHTVAVASDATAERP